MSPGHPLVFPATSATSSGTTSVLALILSLLRRSQSYDSVESYYSRNMGLPRMGPFEVPAKLSELDGRRCLAPVIHTATPIQKVLLSALPGNMRSKDRGILFVFLLASLPSRSKSVASANAAS